MMPIIYFFIHYNNFKTCNKNEKLKTQTISLKTYGHDFSKVYFPFLLKNSIQMYFYCVDAGCLVKSETLCLRVMSCLCLHLLHCLLNFI